MVKCRSSGCAITLPSAGGGMAKKTILKKPAKKTLAEKASRKPSPKPAAKPREAHGRKRRSRRNGRRTSRGKRCRSIAQTACPGRARESADPGRACERAATARTCLGRVAGRKGDLGRHAGRVQAVQAAGDHRVRRFQGRNPSQLRRPPAGPPFRRLLRQTYANSMKPWLQYDDLAQAQRMQDWEERSRLAE